MKKIFVLLVVTLILSVIFRINIPKDGNKDTEYEKYTNNDFSTNLCLKIENNNLCLTNGNEIIKSYDINISVLPSEDIYILTEGIPVKDVSEADSVAENFDG